MTVSRTQASGTNVRFTFEDRPLTAREGDSVAAALLAAGIDRTRTTPRRNKPRLPYCMMGVCFDCLVEIDGQANQQACMIEVRDGMEVRTQDDAREVLL